MFLAKEKKVKEEEPAEEEIETVELTEEEFAEAAKSLFAEKDPVSEYRTLGLYGDINQERCSEVLASLLLYEHTEKAKPEEERIPIEFYVSTYGGSAMDMFAVYDVVRNVQNNCQVKTYGIGKVMSAGVLLLAAGTKGERRIGANCRVMIHGVIAGQHGNLHDVENEFEESKFIQKQYVKALSEETNMTQSYLKKLIQRKTNVYFDAKQAVELGIADIII